MYKHELKIRRYQEDDASSFRAVYATRYAALTPSSALTATSGCTGIVLDSHRSTGPVQHIRGADMPFHHTRCIGHRNGRTYDWLGAIRPQ